MRTNRYIFTLLPIVTILLTTSAAFASPEGASKSSCSRWSPALNPILARGEAYLQNEQYEEAQKLYTKAMAQFPHDLVLYRRRADAYNLGHKKDLAIADWDKLISIIPKECDNYIFRGRVYEHAGNESAALRDYQKAMSSGCFVAYKDGARVCERLKKYDLCIEYWTHTIERVRPLERIPFYFDRAKIYQKLGKADLAEKDKAMAAKLLKECGTENLDKYPSVVPKK